MRWIIKCGLLTGLVLVPAIIHAQALTLGKGFVLGPAGGITADPTQVISGKRSISGSYFGAQTYTSFLYTDPSIIQLLPNQSYKVTFSYRIITAPSTSFSVIIYSPTAASSGQFLPGTNITGSAGMTRTATLISTLGSFTDYEVLWSIAGTGAIVIDDIQIVNSATGQIVITEAGEGPTIKPGLLNFSITDSQSFTLGPIGQTTNVIRSAALKDLDGDGYPEAILTVTTYPDQLPQPPTILSASTKITLETNTFFPSGGPTLRHSPLTQFVDINGDGVDDILFAESGLDHPPWTGSVIGVGLSNGQKAFTNVSPLIPSELQTVKAYTLAAGDINGDGRVKVILPDTYSGIDTALLHWNGSGFDVQKNWIDQNLWAAPTKLSSQERLIVTDLDGDGYQDLLIGGQNWVPNTQALFGSPDGFTADNLLTLPDGQFGHTSFETFSKNGVPIARGANVDNIVVADLNNDGIPDIFTLQEQVVNYRPGVITNKSCDNYADVLANGGTCSEEGEIGLQVFLNKGGRNFGDYTSASTASILGRRLYEAVLPVDINNDGFMDVVGIYYTKPYVGEPGFAWGTTIFLNDGTGAFQVVDGTEILPVAVISSSASDRKWELGGFLPTVVRPGRTEGVIVESVSGSCTSSACPVTANALNVYKVVANGSIGTGPNFADPAPLGAPGFNEFYYLRHYPDAVAAVQAGQYPNGLAHYLAVGKAKGYLAHAPNPLGPPVVTGVVNAAGGQPGVASGAFVSIYGSNFTPLPYNDWCKSIINGRLPKQLDGISVTIGGKPAYIYAVTPGQINVQAPDVGNGPAAVVVTTDFGSSIPFATSSQLYSPAFFPWPANQPVATHLDYTIAAKNGTFSGLTTVPAKPGEVITLWGTGFGPTNPAVPAGQEPTIQAAPTQNPVTVTLGGTTVPVLGAVLSSYAAVYQIAIQIPESMPDGDFPIQASVDGMQSPGNVVLAVHQ
jgi:uncharacterized protein (TIGR03437 family)